MPYLPSLRKLATWVICWLTIPISTAMATAKYEPPDGSIYYGYCASGYWSETGMQNTLDRIYERVSDKPFLLYSFFVHAKEKGRWNGWRWRAEGPNGKPVHGSGTYLERVRDNGFVPVIAWTWMDWRDHSQSPTLDGLIRGEYDWYLDDWINGLKEFGTPVFIRLSHEMDGGWYPYSEGFPGSDVTAEDYVRYWKYVVDRFRTAGVDNVAWVWCVSGGRQGKRDWTAYYPGDEYVDWVAADVYSNRPGSTTLRELQEELGKDKPIMVPEGGTEDLLTQYNQNFPGNKEWIRDFYNTILNDMDNQVKAVCWFHWNEHSYVDRDPEQVPVYRDFIERPAFINELHNEESTVATPDTIEPEIRIIDSVNFTAVGDSRKISARFVGFVGSTGCKWSVDAGDPAGLDIQFSGNQAVITAQKTGSYAVKIQAWSKEEDQFASRKISVTVNGGDTQPESSNPSTGDDGDAGIPGKVKAPATLELKDDGVSFKIRGQKSGFAERFGAKWNLLTGDPQGLLIESNGIEAKLTPLSAGTYVVKFQAWDSDEFDSATMQVVVTPNTRSYSVETNLSAPENLQLIANGQAKTVEIDLVGFSGKIGVKWELVKGDSRGLVLVDNFSSATIQGSLPGIYTIKVQAWDASHHETGYVEVVVVDGNGDAPVTNEIVAPDWLQLVADGSEYQINAAVVGFQPKGQKWSIQRGFPKGVALENEGLRGYLRGWVAGDYVVKVEAWKGEKYVSHHIRVTVQQ